MTTLIDRPVLRSKVCEGLERSPVTAILGPRQCGKTTLARQIASERDAEYFDLEEPRSASRLADPMLALKPLTGLVVIDEVQLRPDIFPILRVLADRRPLPAKFLLLGSASPELARGSSESLAGRIEFVRMDGFALDEVGESYMRKLWLSGGFPRAYLARTEHDSRVWRDNFVETFLERDLRRFGVQTPPEALRRLWTMLAHYHGQVLNASELGRSLSESYSTIKRHVDILTGAMMVRRLQPWHENLRKRQVKSPKLYVRDSGLLHALLGIESFAQLEGHPKIGGSWEGFGIEHILRIVGERNSYFWACYSGSELDLLAFHKGKRLGFEFKYAEAPRMTRSMHEALKDLRLDYMFVVCPGSGSYALSDKIEVTTLAEVDARITAIAE